MPKINKPNARDDNDVYLELVRAFPLRVIKNDDELDAASSVLDQLLGKPSLLNDEEEYFRALEHFIESYESKHHAIEPLPDHELIKQLLLDNNLTQVQFAHGTGIAETTVSVILNGKRRLTRDQIGLAARYFSISVDSFSHGPYNKVRVVS